MEIETIEKLYLYVQVSDIINEIHEDGSLQQACRNININMAADLYQEAILRLMELGHEKLNKIYSGGYIHFYAIRLVVNESKGKSKLNRQMGREDSITSTLPHKTYNISDRIDDRDLLLKVKMELKKFSKMDQEMFRIYHKLGSYRKVEKETGIPYCTVRYWVNEMKEHIEQKFGKEWRS